MRRNPIRNAFLAIAVLVLVGTGVLLRGYTIQFTRADDAEQSERQAKATTAQIAEPAATSADDILRACKSDPDAVRKAGISCPAAAKTKAAIDDADATVTPRDGTDGRDATFSQVLTAVNRLAPAALVAYCSTRDDCVGKAGDDAPPITQAQVDAAVRRVGPGLVAAYCSTRNDCRGPQGESVKGDKGDTVKGDPGEPGRGIQSASCGDDGRWTVTYTDGTSEDAGECRASILP